MTSISAVYVVNCEARNGEQKIRSDPVELGRLMEKLETIKKKKTRSNFGMEIEGEIEGNLEFD